MSAPSGEPAISSSSGNKRWTPEDKSCLLDMKAQGFSNEDIAKKLKRTREAVIQMNKTLPEDTTLDVEESSRMLFLMLKYPSLQPQDLVNHFLYKDPTKVREEFDNILTRMRSITTSHPTEGELYGNLALSMLQAPRSAAVLFGGFQRVSPEVFMGWVREIESKIKTAAEFYTRQYYIFPSDLVPRVPPQDLGIDPSFAAASPFVLGPNYGGHNFGEQPGGNS